MNDFDGNVIAVTGSNGKTTTKDLISIFLKKKDTMYLKHKAILIPLLEFL
ncbi:MAG: hypothetical protein CM1200mP31_4900 [Candidatus Neomarinimicrobiota bacterium]|nr:MAG: hypothetical protein CM1200mP31_4900 [Candidatus Neomarinimicrobiota bacterium]